MTLPKQVYQNRFTTALDRWAHLMARHWLLWLNLGVGLYAALPWIAPLAQSRGWQRLAWAIYRTYAYLCHQQPEISYHVLGHQVAYCQRDTAIYTTILAAGLLFGLLRRRLRPLPWWAFFLSITPLALDGLTQAPGAILEEWPLRTQNHWAVVLTGGIFPGAFYAGDAIGHLNWWLRTISGVLFGLGLVLAVYPRIEEEMRRTPPQRSTHPLQQGHALDVEGLGKQVQGLNADQAIAPPEQDGQIPR